MRTDRTDATPGLSPQGATRAAWQPISPARARALTDARLQLHHAAQLATAAGISFLPPRPDDSHTNLEWLAASSALASRAVPAGGGTAFRVAVRVPDLTLLLLPAAPDGRELESYALHGRTLRDAGAWLAAAAGELGADARRFTLARHYEIPAHAVARGAPFDAGAADDFAELARWFGNADGMLRALAAATAGASEVRCWPHHFDIATLIDAGAGRSVGAGLEPGDESYAEPYWYVSPHPSPAAGAALPTLAGGGFWHTAGWTGAVLRGSGLTPDASRQREQVEAFLASAVSACRALR
ncbi:MAG TPA: hypothetical protein VKA84_29795 [Gemmatimonadaceae bacterium]|nr:hypothetical protein [Gemmatimonadaceae bacterium]